MRSDPKTFFLTKHDRDQPLIRVLISTVRTVDLRELLAAGISLLCGTTGSRGPR